MSDIITYFKSNSEFVFVPNDFRHSIPMVLCILPNLSLNGAQTVFKEVLELLIEHGSYQYCIISPEDGSFRSTYIDMGCLVCVRPYITVSDEFRKTLQTSFKAVFMNTALVYGYSLYFINTDTPVFWWIHESVEHLKACCYTMPDPRLLSSNFHIYGVTSRVKRAYQELYDFKLGIMPMSIRDVHNDYIPHYKQDKITFFIPAAYTPIKGQDILLSAISELPEYYTDRARFLFCGYYTTDNEQFYNRIIELSKNYNCITHLGQLNRSETYQYYADCDCVIAPSRADSTPTTIVEAMMFHKLTLVSDKTGISEFITDCVSGFVFHSSDELIKRLLLIISDIDALKHVAENGNKIWLEYFSPDKVLNILSESGVFEL